jgi:hypothetical protein
MKVCTDYIKCSGYRLYVGKIPSSEKRKYLTGVELQTAGVLEAPD